MSFIDWSDPEEMLGLLAEYAADAHLGEEQDRRRARFLERLSSDLAAFASDAPALPVRVMVDRLRGIHDSQPAEFAADPVLQHVDDCIQELERIAAQRDERTG